MNFIDVYGIYPNHLKHEEYAVKQSTIYLHTNLRLTLKTQISPRDQYTIVESSEELYQESLDSTWVQIRILTQLELDNLTLQPLRGWVRKDDLASLTVFENSREERLSFELVHPKYLGVKYRWGGKSSESTDCSGLVYQIYRDMGYTLPRYANGQYEVCLKIKPQDLVPGDLIFGVQVSNGFNPVHVMIYLGDDKFMESCGLENIFTTHVLTFQQKWNRPPNRMWSGWAIEGSDYQLFFGRPLIK